MGVMAKWKAGLLSLDLKARSQVREAVSQRGGEDFEHPPSPFGGGDKGDESINLDDEGLPSVDIVNSVLVIGSKTAAHCCHTWGATNKAKLPGPVHTPASAFN